MNFLTSRNNATTWISVQVVLGYCKIMDARFQKQRKISLLCVSNIMNSRFCKIFRDIELIFDAENVFTIKFNGYSGTFY